MGRNFLAVAVILLSTTLAKAQFAGNAFLGYSLDNASSSTAGIINGNRILLNGWDASVEVKAYRWLGAVANFSGHYGSGKQSFTSPTVFFTYDAREHDFLFGPRLSATSGRVRPFVEALFGVGYVDTTTDDVPVSQSSFAFALGGGVDCKLTKMFDWRVETDYMRTHFFTMGAYSVVQNNFRMSTGLVVRF